MPTAEPDTLETLATIAKLMKTINPTAYSCQLGTGHTPTVELLRSIGARMSIHHYPADDNGPASVIEAADIECGGLYFSAQHNLDPATAPPATVEMWF